MTLNKFALIFKIPFIASFNAMALFMSFTPPLPPQIQFMTISDGKMHVIAFYERGNSEKTQMVAAIDGSVIK